MLGGSKVSAFRTASSMRRLPAFCATVLRMSFYDDGTGRDQGQPGQQQSGPQPWETGPGYPTQGFPPPGYPHQPYAYPPQVPGTNGMAIAALIVSLASCGPVGLILGILSLNQIKKSGEQGRGMALAGVIIGAISIVAWIAVIIFTIWAINEVDTYDPYYNYNY